MQEMATPMEVLFLNIFLGRDRVIDQMREQSDLFEQAIASKLLIQGIRPPPWLRPNRYHIQPTSEDIQDLRKEELFSGLLFPPPKPPIPTSTKQRYRRPPVLTNNTCTSGNFLPESFASNIYFDSKDIGLHHLAEGKLNQSMTLDEIPKIDFVSASPPLEKDAEAEHYDFGADQSPERIQLLGSSQKALEITRSVEANDNKLTEEDNIQNDCSSRSARFKTPEEPCITCEEIPKPENYSTCTSNDGSVRITLGTSTITSEACTSNGIEGRGSHMSSNGYHNVSAQAQECTLNEVPVFDIPLNSPQFVVKEKICDIDYKPDQSLLRIQRSRSRQKALEARSGAGPETKIRKKDFGNAVYEGRITRSRVSLSSLNNDPIRTVVPPRDTSEHVRRCTTSREALSQLKWVDVPSKASETSNLSEVHNTEIASSGVLHITPSYTLRDVSSSDDIEIALSSRGNLAIGLGKAICDADSLHFNLDTSVKEESMYDTDMPASPKHLVFDETDDLCPNEICVALSENADRHTTNVDLDANQEPDDSKIKESKFNDLQDAHDKAALQAKLQKEVKEKATNVMKLVEISVTDDPKHKKFFCFANGDQGPQTETASSNDEKEKLVPIENDIHIEKALSSFSTKRSNVYSQIEDSMGTRDGDLFASTKRQQEIFKFLKTNECDTDSRQNSFNSSDRNSVISPHIKGMPDNSILKKSLSPSRMTPFQEISEYPSNMQLLRNKSTKSPCICVGPQIVTCSDEIMGKCTTVLCKNSCKSEMHDILLERESEMQTTSMNERKRNNCGSSSFKITEIMNYMEEIPCMQNSTNHDTSIVVKDNKRTTIFAGCETHNVQQAAQFTTHVDDDDICSRSREYHHQEKSEQLKETNSSTHEIPMTKRKEDEHVLEYIFSSSHNCKGDDLDVAIRSPSGRSSFGHESEVIQDSMDIGMKNKYSDRGFQECLRNSEEIIGHTNGTSASEEGQTSQNVLCAEDETPLKVANFSVYDKLVDLGPPNGDSGLLSKSHSRSLCNEGIKLSGSDKTKPEFEGFSVGTPNGNILPFLMNDGVNFENSSILEHNKGQASILEEQCRSRVMPTPLIHTSCLHKTNNPDIYESGSNGLLDHVDLSGLERIQFGVGDIDMVNNAFCTVSEELDANLGMHFSDCQGSSDSQRKPPYTPPASRFSQRTILSSTGTNSGRQVSLNPEFTCFRIDEDVVMSLNENGEMQEDVPLKPICLDEGGSCERDKSTDGISQCYDPSIISVPEMFQVIQNLDSVKKKLSSSKMVKNVKDICTCESERRHNNDDIENQFYSLGRNSPEMNGQMQRNKSTNLKPPEKSNLVKEVMPLVERGLKTNNIVSNISSFIPLVQQKQQATGTFAGGKRDVKVKALEAAEVARRLEERKQNERKMKKEAAKLQRARSELEKLRQLEFQQKKKAEDSKRKEIEFAQRKQQKEQEKRKERGKKRKCFEETRKLLKEQEEKLRAEKEENVLQRRTIEEKKKKELTKEGIKKQKMGKEVVQSGCVNRKYIESNVPRIFVDNENKLAGNALDNSRTSEDIGSIAKAYAGTHDVKEDGLVFEGNEMLHSCEISPYRGSEDEDEEEVNIAKKKFIPLWAREEYFLNFLKLQQRIIPSTIFPPSRCYSLDEVLQPRQQNQNRYGG